MSESKKPWVPGFIWVTPYPEHENRPEEPVLVPVAEIVRVRKMTYLYSQIECSRTIAVWCILETPDQVAALIREEWRQRVRNEAIVRAEYGSGQYPVEGNVDERVSETA